MGNMIYWVQSILPTLALQTNFTFLIDAWVFHGEGPWFIDHKHEACY